MNNPRLVVLDLDGTTLDSQKNISPESQAFFRMIQTKGIRLMFATGRPLRAAIRYYNELGMHGRIVCANGGLIIDPSDNNKVYFREEYPKSLIEGIVEGIGFENFANLMVEDGNKLFVGYQNDVMKGYCYTSGMEVIYGNRFSECQHPTNGTFVLKDDSFAKRLTDLGGNTHKDVGIRFWTGTLVGELYFNNVNKYTGMMAVADYYGIRQDDIIAFGDADNDIEMLSKAGIGVAMKNGSPTAARYASMVSLDDDNHDGVMKTLKFLLADYL
jgi:Cof subfamily protein (haloacid dehalogenase superfamily)